MSNILELSRLLKKNRLTEILAEFERQRKENEASKNLFNLFSIISPFYYRENLHSEVIWYFLNPDSNHGAGDKYLRLFVDFLSKAWNSTFNEVIFSKIKVLKEVGKIDILVEGDMNAIIIENKINNAIDMRNQIPRYNEYVTSRGKQVLCIIYLTLDGGRPDFSTWELAGDQAEAIKKKIFNLSACSNSENDLINGWIKPCINETTNEDVKSFLRQYSNLIQKLRKKNMDSSLMRDFAKFLITDDNHKSVISMQGMLSILPDFLALEISERYHVYAPFELTIRNRSKVYFDKCKIDEFTFKIVIEFINWEYRISFHEQNIENKIATRMLLERTGLKQLGEFFDYEFVKVIPFAEKCKVFDFVDTLFEALCKFKDSGDRLLKP